jgi:hypothetical protein
MTEHDRGSFRVTRAVFDHPALRGEPYNKTLAWLSLIADAAWSQRTVIRDRQIVRLERGQLAASHRFLAERWDWEHHRVARFLELLTTLGMIRRHKVGTIGVITITNYESYQAPEPARHPRGIRAPQTEAPNEAPENCETADGTGVYAIEQSVSEAANEALTPHGSSENRGKTNKQIKESKTPSFAMTDREIGSAFDSWWKAYPKKQAKGQARKAYAAAIKKATVDQLEKGAERYAAERAGQDDKYTKHPATWLNGECWADERTATTSTPNGAKAPDDAFWRERVERFRENGIWAVPGPKPGERGCRVPSHILAELNLLDGVTP